MLPGIHYAGWREIAERYGRGVRLILQDVARESQGPSSSHLGIGRFIRFRAE